jgi:hypothetical protein
MVRCSADKGIDGRIIQNAAEVRHQFCFATHLGDPPNARLTALAIGFADILDDDPRDLHHLLGEVSAPAISHHPDDHRLRDILDGLLGMDSPEGECVCNGSGC